MVTALWMMAQLLVVSGILVCSVSLPEAPSQAVLLGVVAALYVAATVAAVVYAPRLRALWHALPPLAQVRRRAPRVFLVAADPGIPGAVLVRAPARLVSPLG